MTLARVQVMLLVRGDVPLEEVNVGFQVLALLLASGLDIRQAFMAVYLRLASAEEVEVGAVDNQDSLLSVTHFGLQ